MGTWDAPPTQQGPFRFGTTGAGQPANVLSRVVAWIIDSVIIWVVGLIVTFLTSLLHLTALGWLFSAAVSLGYWTYFWGSTGQTLGYRVMHIRAVTQSGEQLGYGWAFMRGLLVDLSCALCAIPAIIILNMTATTEKRQALHDLVLGTAVVNA